MGIPLTGYSSILRFGIIILIATTRKTKKTMNAWKQISSAP
jgi:hypothetical protein